MDPKVEVTQESALFSFRKETLSSADYVQAVGSGNRCDKGVVAQSSPLDLGCFGWESRCLLRKSVDPVSTLVALLSVTIWSWASLWWRLVSILWQEGDREMSVYKYSNSVIGGNIARLGEFSSLACTAWQTGGVALFFLTGGSITALICHPSLALMCESKTCCAY